MGKLGVTTKEVLCEVLEAYRPTSWWQSLLKMWLLKSCAASHGAGDVTH
jgi:hypothetical protein